MENLPSREDEIYVIGNAPSIQFQEFQDKHRSIEVTIPLMDQTLGFMIRDELLKSKAVGFVGIRQPHPLKKTLMFRVQLVEGAEDDIKILFKEATDAVYQTLGEIEAAIQSQ